jgi:hypothetical protein
LVLGGLALAAVAAAIIIVATSGGSQRASHTSASKPAARPRTHRSQSTTSSSGGSPAASSGGSAATSSGGSASTSSGGSATGGAGTPVSAVESFYHLAAAHQYSSAWALADPTFQNQLGGYSSFQGGQAADRSITFNSAGVTNQTGNSATVYIRTTSVRDNGTQHCFGPVSLIRGSSGWRLDHISINCTA